MLAMGDDSVSDRAKFRTDQSTFALAGNVKPSPVGTDWILPSPTGVTVLPTRSEVSTPGEAQRQGALPDNKVTELVPDPTHVQSSAGHVKMPCVVNAVSTTRCPFGRMVNGSATTSTCAKTRNASPSSVVRKLFICFSSNRPAVWEMAEERPGFAAARDATTESSTTDATTSVGSFYLRLSRLCELQPRVSSRKKSRRGQLTPAAARPRVDRRRASRGEHAGKEGREQWQRNARNVRGWPTSARRRCQQRASDQ